MRYMRQIDRAKAKTKRSGKRKERHLPSYATTWAEIIIIITFGENICMKYRRDNGSGFQLLSVGYLNNSVFNK